MYALKADRPGTGFTGEYETMDEALERAKDYENSFPGEVNSIHIRKVPTLADQQSQDYVKTFHPDIEPGAAVVTFPRQWKPEHASERIRAWILYEDLIPTARDLFIRSNKRWGTPVPEINVGDIMVTEWFLDEESNRYTRARSIFSREEFDKKYEYEGDLSSIVTYVKRK